MRLSHFCLVLAAAIGVDSVPAHAVHEKRADISLEAWTRGNPVASSLMLPVRIGLTQSNLDEGHDRLMAMSDPASPSYGKHMTAEEIIDLFAPSEDSVQAVKSWVVSAGFSENRVSQSVNKQWIQFEATALQLESLLHTKFYTWHHKVSQEEDIGCSEYSVPLKIRHHIDYITPGIRLRSFRKKKGRHSDSIDGTSISPPGPHAGPDAGFKSPPPFRGVKHCNTNSMVPQCIAAAYGITKGTLKQKGNEIGIYETENIVYRQADLDNFTRNYYPTIPQGYKPEAYLSIDHASFKFNPDHNGDGETMLDVDMSLPIIYPQGFKIWQVNTQTAPGIFNPFLDALDGSYCNYTAYGITGDTPGVDPTYKRPLQCGIYKPTNVITASYGIPEAALPVNYVKRQCNEFMKLGMQGVSFFAASGDSGVGGTPQDPCLGKEMETYSPQSPSTCPYVTSVGGTLYPSGKTNVLDHKLETACTASGGGFSNVFPTPDYQRSAVSTYLTKHKPFHKSYSTKNGKNIGANGGFYNRAGRGIPDVSATFQVICCFQNICSQCDGTSASTPIWASVVNRINEERLARGKSVVGFINPALYARPQAMHDITSGHNVGCLTVDVAFNATEGWDAVTGLGSPSYPDLLKYFLSLP